MIPARYDVTTVATLSVVAAVTKNDKQLVRLLVATATREIVGSCSNFVRSVGTGQRGIVSPPQIQLDTCDQPTYDAGDEF